jgi:cell division protein FtsI/penicillin-binding protein 2
MATYTDLAEQRRRIAWLNIGLILIGLVVVARLAQLQVARRHHYRVLAATEHMRKYQVPARRGEIFVLDQGRKTPLALNRTMKVLWADPRVVADKPKAAKEIAAVTGDKEADLLNLLNQQKAYVVLKKKLTLAQGEQIDKLNLSGIGVSEEQYRYYPEGSLASQVLGFVNNDGAGQYGVEGFLNTELSGKPGLLNAKTDTRGNPIATVDNIVQPPEHGKSFVLTMDRNIQAQAEKSLKSGVESVKAKSGSIVIMDPHTGKVMAMANYPTFDPNGFSSVSDYSVFSNAVVSDQFEPGSGFKVITMVAGLDTGKIRFDETYDDKGSVEVDGHTIRNAAGHRLGANTSMTNVIRDSLNTGMVYVLRTLGGDQRAINSAGKKLFHEYIKKFGFGVRTGVEQAGEAAGRVNPPTSNNVNYANMTFGQGISTTVLQMTAAVGAIANGGKLYQPMLVGEIVEEDGKTKQLEPKLVNGQVVSQKAAKEVTEMMVQVVEHGSGWRAKMKGYRIAGKTGTAQIPKKDGSGYEENKNIGTFVGFAPVENPRFVMMVRINEPQVSGFAESTTVPVFAEVTEWLLRYMAVQPSS